MNTLAALVAPVLLATVACGVTAADGGGSLQADSAPAQGGTIPGTTSNPAADGAAALAAAQAAQAKAIGELSKLLGEQSRQLEAQRRQLESQEQKIATLTRELDALRAPPPQVEEEASAQDVQVVEAAPAAGTAPAEPAAAAAPATDTDKPQSEAKKKTGEAVAQAQQDDPTRVLLEDFRGAWRLPGTDAALSIGGYVKTAIVWNFDPLEITDRFIVGSIPVTSDAIAGAEAESSVTANQSRLNFDLREPTDFGVLRAFIEGDFAEENDTFRLRHAFGQWNKMLAGKTWSAFVDTQATPEEVDFEGLNGRINVRQSQVRLMPRIGEEYEFQFSLEDPNPQIQNGSGVTRIPDLVMSARFRPRPELQTKVSLLGRQIRAQRTELQGGSIEQKRAWGLSLSGRYHTPQLDARDNLLFQVNYGEGIGRYVNDLASVGQFDGIFDPQDGDLDLFEIFAGYLSWQHWWGRNQMRSNFTLGLVEVDNPAFVDGDAYKQTIRFSSNLFWSPTPRIDIGGEYLWGTRENEDGSDGDAQQIQMALRYRF